MTYLAKCDAVSRQYFNESALALNIKVSRSSVSSWKTSFITPVHSGRWVLSCLALSARPALITTLQPTIFHGSCSYLAQSLTLVWAWTLLIIGFLCSFSRIPWYFEILWIHWHASWSRPTEGSCPLDGIYTLVSVRFSGHCRWIMFVINQRNHTTDSHNAQTNRAPSQYKDRLIYVWRFPC